MDKDNSNPVDAQGELVDIWDVEVEDETIDKDEEELEDVQEAGSDKEDLEKEEPEKKEESEEEDIEEASDEVEDVPLVKSIQNLLGYEFEDEFEDTEEGIAQMFEAAKNKAADESLNILLDKYPEAKELIEYRELGGDPDEFFKVKFPDTDFNEIEFNEEDNQQHEMLVRQDLRTKGYSEKEIDADIEDFKNGGILENKAKRALSSLQAKQQEDQEKLLEKQQEKHAEQQAKIEEYWKGVKKTINESTTFKSFNIPSKDKDAFFQYISKPVKDGKSQRDLDVEESDIETQLAVDFLLFKGFDINDIVERKAKNMNAKTLKERLKESKLNKKEDKTKSEYTEELGTI